MRTTHDTPETFDILAVIDRATARRRWKRAAQIACGAALLSVGLRRPSPLGFLIGAIGAGLAVRGLTGKRLEVLFQEISRKLAGREQRPSFDKVDQGSALSFPASDPPAL